MKPEDDNPALAFVWKMVREAVWSVRYHEHELHRAYTRLAAAKAMMERGNYTEFTVAEIEADVEKANRNDDDD